MRLEIPLKEVQDFLRDQYSIKIDLKNIEEDKIEATYIDKVVLIIEEVKKEVVFLKYEVDGVAVFASKVAHFFLDNLLKFAYISELHFRNDIILFVFYVRDKA